MKHYTIPFFIIHKGCPFKCIFCDQKNISGQSTPLKATEIKTKIKAYLKTFSKTSKIEVGFFGGTFTGLSTAEQVKYLKAVQPFITSGQISGIRLSTRPDHITQKIIDVLKKYHVTCIELGVQSMDDTVLKKAKRGHCFSDIKKASELIRKNKVRLGHQLMVGLPGSSLSKEIKSAQLSTEMKAKEVRIYPLVIIKDTALEKMYRSKKFKPISLQTAIKRSALMIKIFETNKIKVIRCGLHPSDTLSKKDTLLAGPFHPAFKQLVEAYIFRQLLKKNISSDLKTIYYNPKDTTYVIGQKRKNAFFVEKKLNSYNIFKANKAVKKGYLKFENKTRKNRTVYKYE